MLKAGKYYVGDLCYVLDEDNGFDWDTVLHDTGFLGMFKPGTKEDIAYTPIGIPLIAGPGAITSVMILSSERPRDIALFTDFITELMSSFLIKFGQSTWSTFAEDYNKIPAIYPYNKFRLRDRKKYIKMWKLTGWEWDTNTKRSGRGLFYKGDTLKYIFIVIEWLIEAFWGGNPSTKDHLK